MGGQNPIFFRGFHLRTRAPAHPRPPGFSLLYSGGATTNFGGWLGLSTQDGTFGDSQRHGTRDSPTGLSLPQNDAGSRSGIVHARRRGIASRTWRNADEFKVWFEKGETDGQRRSRRLAPRLLAGSAGRRTECACDPEFNLHGMSTSTTSRHRSSSSMGRCVDRSVSTARSAFSGRAIARTRRSGGPCA